MHSTIRLAVPPRFFLVVTLALAFAVSACRPSVDPATLEALERTRSALDERASALDERSRAIEARIAEIEKKAIESENAELKKEVERLKDESKTLRSEADRAIRESEKLARQIEAERAKMPGPQLDRSRDQRDYSMFYRELAPYGVWFDVAGYGYCFQPRVARDPSWRPYVDGRWVWSDRGWAWSSNEPFGWIVYHYGRWLLTVGHGWIWVPDVEWAPAWVAWRRGDEYIGWAPLPPERGIAPSFIGADADIRYRLGPPHYTFIEINFFAAPTYVRHCRPVVYNTTIIHQTINITNIIYIGEKKRRKCYVRGGPDRREIERRCGSPIPVTRIAELEEGQSPPENWAETDHESRKILHAAVLPESAGEEAKPENVEARIEPQPIVAEPNELEPPPGQPEQGQPPVVAQESIAQPLEATSESDAGNESTPVAVDVPEASPSKTAPIGETAKDSGESRDSADAPVETVIRSVEEPDQHSEEQARIQQAEAEARAAEAAERERQDALEREREQEALAAERQRQQEELDRQEEAAAREEQRRAAEEARRQEQMERMRQQEEERERREQEEFARQRQLEEMERRRAEEEARRQEQMEQMRRQQEEDERRQMEEYERRQQEEFARQQREEEEYRRAQAEMERRQREEQERWAAEQRRAEQEAAREQARAQREAEAAREAERESLRPEMFIQPYDEELGQ